MHRGIVMTEDQGEEKKSLNKGKSNDTLRINRGVELLLRNRRRISEPKTFQVRVGKMISFLRREIHFFFELSLDIKKASKRGK